MPEFHKNLASAELVSPHPRTTIAHVLTQDLQACAINYLHNQGIIHRDIRLENVALRDGHVVLGDFGLALRLGVPQLSAPVHAGGSVHEDNSKTLRARGLCGTLPYMAPEVLGDMQYSFGVDWFAYGVFLHVFYTDKVRVLLWY
jgi:serine/threonine protein kinase